MVLPARVEELCRACANAGGRALLVGGSVRDDLLGRPVKDLDIEVHRLDLDTLTVILQRFGRVSEVGRSFGVLKLRVGGRELDVSLPRRDSKAGLGHKGIRAEADPHMGEREAARRRDLTVNAIAYDPLDGTYVDPFGGRDDLTRGLLRAVDRTTFTEDPLRALRAAQFVGRFGFRADPALVELCRTMPLHELPAERIRGEVEKLLLRSPAPSLGWAFAREAGLWARVLPTWDHDALPALDRCAAAAPLPVPDAEARRLALLYAAASADEAALSDVLERVRVFRVGGHDVRRTALALARHAGVARPGMDGAAEGSAVLDAPTLRRLADETDLRLLALLRDDARLRADAAALGVLDGPLPPILAGRDLLALGVQPGPRVGALLAELRTLQLDGVVTDAEAAHRWATARVGAADPSAARSLRGAGERGPT
jgi:tRNA nucleotidyltransferase (CCA-adding enzyme)